LTALADIDAEDGVDEHAAGDDDLDPIGFDGEG